VTIQGVIFDYGNVLARTLDPEPRANWERKLGLRSGELQRVVHNDGSWIAAQQGRITPEAHWQEVGATLALTADETAAVRAAFYQGDVLNGALVARIDQMRAAGLRTALLSNFSTELRRLLTAQDLVRRFDEIAISAEIGVMKPNAGAYWTLLNRLALQAHACVFIDDQPANVEAAQTLGLHGIVFRDTITCLTRLDRLLSGSLDDENRASGCIDQQTHGHLER
jgi:epoxide hydrolase-like predicted phosphatase